MSENQSIGLSTIVVRRDDIPTTDLDGEIGMMDIDSGMYYALDQVSTEIWQLIVTPVAVSEIVYKLLEEYEVDENTCRSQIVEFLNKMYENSLINIV